MSDILLVVVIYKISADELIYLKELSDIEILIYDNSPQIQKPSLNFHYFHDTTNPGVSTGYNYGISLARKLGKKAVILLDQDTVFTKDALNSYITAYSKYGDEYIYAPIISGNGKIYSPFIERRYRNLWQRQEDFEKKEIYKICGKSLINSGLMIPVALTDKIGLFNPRIKLDFSDIYFINKYKLICEEIVLLDVNLSHGLSGDEGKDQEKELNRFMYFCNGARELRVSSSDKSKPGRFVLYRTLRLIQKYFSLTPIRVASKYYCGKETI